MIPSDGPPQGSTNEAVHMWAFGVILHQLITGYHPFFYDKFDPNDPNKRLPFSFPEYLLSLSRQKGYVAAEEFNWEEVVPSETERNEWKKLFEHIFAHDIEKRMSFSNLANTVLFRKGVMPIRSKFLLDRLDELRSETKDHAFTSRFAENDVMQSWAPVYSRGSDNRVTAPAVSTSTSTSTSAPTANVAQTPLRSLNSRKKSSSFVVWDRISGHPLLRDETPGHKTITDRNRVLWEPCTRLQHARDLADIAKLHEDYAWGAEGLSLDLACVYIDECHKRGSYIYPPPMLNTVDTADGKTRTKSVITLSERSCCAMSYTEMFYIVARDALEAALLSAKARTPALSDRDKELQDTKNKLVVIQKRIVQLNEIRRMILINEREKAITLSLHEWNVGSSSTSTSTSKSSARPTNASVEVKDSSVPVTTNSPAASARRARVRLVRSGATTANSDGHDVSLIVHFDDEDPSEVLRSISISTSTSTSTSTSAPPFNFRSLGALPRTYRLLTEFMTAVAACLKELKRTAAVADSERELRRDDAVDRVREQWRENVPKFRHVSMFMGTLFSCHAHYVLCCYAPYNAFALRHYS